MEARGKFITLEGGDGCGKTTQARLLFKALWEADINSQPTHEPGGTPGADMIRALLVQGDPGRWDNVTELLLHMAARRDHVERLVKPALATGEWIICDRFLDSTLAYQGYGQGLDVPVIKEMQRMVVPDLQPDLTLIFHLEVEKSLERARQRRDVENRYERMDVAFHKRLREGFLEIAKEEPERCVVIDSSHGIVEMHEAVIEAVNQQFSLQIPPLSEALIYDV